MNKNKVAIQNYIPYYNMYIQTTYNVNAHTNYIQH